MKKHGLLALVLTLAYLASSPITFAGEPQPKIDPRHWKTPKTEQEHLDNFVVKLTEANKDPVLLHIQSAILQFDNPTKLLFSIEKQAKAEKSTSFAHEGPLGLIIPMLKKLTPEQYVLIRQRIQNLRTRTTNDNKSPSPSAIAAKQTETFFVDNHPKLDEVKPKVEIADFLGTINVLDELLDARRSCGPLADMAAKVEKIKQDIAANVKAAEDINKEIEGLGQTAAKSITPDLQRKLDKVLAAFPVATDKRAAIDFYRESLADAMKFKDEAAKKIIPLLREDLLTALAENAPEAKDLDTLVPSLVDQMLASPHTGIYDSKEKVTIKGKNVEFKLHISGNMSISIGGTISIIGKSEITDKVKEELALAQFREVGTAIELQKLLGESFKTMSDAEARLEATAKAKQALDAALVAANTCHDTVAAIDEKFMKVDPKDVAKPENAAQVQTVAREASEILRGIAESTKSAESAK